MKIYFESKKTKELKTKISCSTDFLRKVYCSKEELSTILIFDQIAVSLSKLVQLFHQKMELFLNLKTLNSTPPTQKKKSGSEKLDSHIHSFVHFIDFLLWILEKWQREQRIISNECCLNLLRCLGTLHTCFSEHKYPKAEQIIIVYSSFFSHQSSSDLQLNLLSKREITSLKDQIVEFL